MSDLEKLPPEPFGYWAPKPGTITSDGIVIGRKGPMTQVLQSGFAKIRTDRKQAAAHAGWAIHQDLGDGTTLVWRS